MNTDFMNIVAGHDVTWLMAIAMPLIMVPIVLKVRLGSFGVLIVPIAAAPSFILSICAAPGLEVYISWLLLGMRFGIDETSGAFLLFTSILWTVSGVYARCYLFSDKDINRFFAFFLVAMAGNFGLILAQEMVSFYLFFTTMSFAAFGLIIHDASSKARRAGKVYIALVVVGEVLMVAGILLIAGNVESFAFNDVRSGIVASPNCNIIIGLLFAGFGVKAGVLPLHIWLPVAHPVAPTPASAVLSGAMIKAGLIGWMRFLPLGEIALPWWGILCVIIGLAAAFYGVFVGLVQRNPKTVLAYSSISQMGFMTVAIGVGLAVPDAVPLVMTAIMFYAIHHSLAKGALFLGVGVLKDAGGTGFQRLLLFAGLLFPALSLSCAPLTSGALAKLTLKNLLYTTTMPWLAVFISLASVGTTLIMGRFLYLMWKNAGKTKSSPRFGLWLPWTLLLICVIFVTWLYVPDKRLSLLMKTVSLNALWPVATGTFLVWAVLQWGNKMSVINKIPQIPSGDLLVFFEPIVQRLRGDWKTNIGLVFSWPQNVLAGRLGSKGNNFVHKEKMEWMKRWHSALNCFIFKQVSTFVGKVEMQFICLSNAGMLIIILVIIFFFLLTIP